jgi:hypothetical protein
MSAQIVSAPTGWSRPPPEECRDDGPYVLTPPDANPNEMRAYVRMVVHDETDTIVEFAVILQTFYCGEWRTVASADSCHDVDVHLHRYSRRTGSRAGEPEKVIDITNSRDLQDGYDLAYDVLLENWRTHRQRWEYA